MNNLELEKMANEIRKDIVTAVHSDQTPDIRVDHFHQQIFLHICILRR